MHADRRRASVADLRSGAFESWELQVVDPGNAAGLSVGMVLTGSGASWWTQLSRAGHDLVVVVDDDVRLPGGPHLEIRTTGLWAEIGIHDPGEHLSVDLEAFGVEIDDVEEVFGAGRGVRVPVGLDVEWHRVAEAQGLEDGHLIVARVEGEILVGATTIELTPAATGSWTHRFGVGPWPGPRLGVGIESMETVAVGAVAVGGWAWHNDLVRDADDGFSWRSTRRERPAVTPDG